MTTETTQIHDVPEQPTTTTPASAPLVTADSGDRCSNCGAPLVSDQRYCLNCGHRRGQSRFSLESMAAQAAPLQAPPPPPRPIRSRMPAGLNLITGVATLLLAMGVGVLIGHDSASNTPTRASQPVVTVVGGGGSGAVASTAKKTTAQSNKGSAKSAPAKTTVIHLSKKTVAAAVSARQKVFGTGSAKNLPPATIQPGQKCPPTDQKGCTNGKFTGSFFGH